jgi:spermidine synthase
MAGPGLFALTLFVSALLLFLVQPMVGKMVLPLFGGAAAVWAACLVFFQLMLLAGYAYAHVSTAWLGARKQAALHFIILLAPIAVLPIAVNRALAPTGAAAPVPWLLLTLFMAVGLPFFVVAASAPLLQKWFADTDHPAARDPYFLYAASNLGSMIALVGYPVLMEPQLTLAAQGVAWAVGYGALVVLIAACAAVLWLSAKTNRDREGADKVKEPAPLPHGRGSFQPLTVARRARWVLLAAVPSSLLLGVTTYLTTDVTAHPLLWMPPLVLYLLSFMLVFSRTPGRVARWLRDRLAPSMRTSPDRLLDGRRFWALALPLLVLMLIYLMLSATPLGVGWLLVLHLTAFLTACMVCHGELARDRPPPERLTEFFLWIAVGGALGGLFNALVAPLLFQAVVEYPLALWMACLALPPLAVKKESIWGFRVEGGLASACALMGMVLIGLRMADGTLHTAGLAGGRWVWPAAAMLAAGVAGTVYIRRRPDEMYARAFDFLLPLALGMLVVGLGLGVSSWAVYGLLSRAVGGQDPLALRKLLAFGLPAVLCFILIDRPLRFGLGLGAFLLAAWFSALFDSSLLAQTRDFYGVLRVETARERDRDYVCLYSGSTLHGMQAADGDDRAEPLVYYHRTGPIGQVFAAYNGAQDPPRDLAVIGLGAGALAAYARPEQKLTFYEIDPAVAALCRDGGYFTYWDDAVRRGARLQLAPGDARLTLENDALSGNEKYGILVVDAFSSDAIPTHLIDREALALYLRRLAEGGLVAFHISNAHIDLGPVLANLAADANVSGLVWNERVEPGGPPGKAGSTWVVIARKAEDLARLPRKSWQELQPNPAVGVWTDDYSNLWGALRPGW